MVAPVRGPARRVTGIDRDGLAELGAAGVDEAIVVVSPITEPTNRALGDALASLKS